MWEEIDKILRQAATQVADHIASFLPGLLVSLMLVLATFVVSLVARVLLARALARARFRSPGGTVGPGGGRGAASFDEPVTNLCARRILDDSQSRASREPHGPQRDDTVAVRAVGVRVRAASVGGTGDPDHRRDCGEVSGPIRADRRREHADPVRSVVQPWRQVARAARDSGHGPRSSRASVATFCCWHSASSLAASCSRPLLPLDSARVTS